MATLMLDKNGIALVSYTEAFDTSTPVGRAMMGLLGVFAQMEREITSERVKSAMLERAAQGKRTCNYALGYKTHGKDSFIIDPKSAEIVRYIYDKYIAYGCLLAVAENCNLVGYRGYRGCNFTAESVKKILTCPVYCGYNKFLGKLYKGNYEPIISICTYNRVQKLLGKPTIKDLLNR